MQLYARVAQLARKVIDPNTLIFLALKKKIKNKTSSNATKNSQNAAKNWLICEKHSSLKPESSNNHFYDSLPSTLLLLQQNSKSAATIERR